MRRTLWQINSRGDAEDALRAAIIPLQADHVYVGKIVLEFEDVVEIGAPPAIDRLVGIAGDRQVGMLDRKRPGDGVLGQVGVLILIHEDEAVALVEVRRISGFSRSNMATCKSRSSKSAALEAASLAW